MRACCSWKQATSLARAFAATPAGSAASGRRPGARSTPPRRRSPARWPPVRTKLNARNTALKTLGEEMRGMAEEWSQVLEEDDPR